MVNEAASADVRASRTGKDAAIYDGDGTMLASIDSFQAQANFNNVTYTPLGCTVELEAPNTTSVTISFEEIVIKDEGFITDVMNFIGTGTLPDWSMQGVLNGLPDSSGNVNEERVKYDHCVPSGSIDIQNFTVGDTIKRSWSLHCNAAPKLLSALKNNR